MSKFSNDVSGLPITSPGTWTGDIDTYRLLFEFLPFPAAVLSFDGVFLFGNSKGAGEILGIRPEQQEGYRFTDFGIDLDDEKLQRVFGMLKAVERGEDAGPVELSFRRPDGTPRVIEMYTTPVIIDGHGPAAVMVIHDVTDRNQTRDALQRSEEFHRLLVGNIPAVSWATDESGKTSFISPNVKEVYGYTPDEIRAGGRDLWFGRIHQDDQERVERAFRALFSNGTSFDVVYRIQHKEGQWIWLNDRASIVRGEGAERHAVGVFSDITERKRAELRLTESEARLSRIYQSAAMAMVFMTRDGKLFDPNELFQKFLGYDADEVAKIGPHGLLLSEYHDRMDGVIKELKDGERLTVPPVEERFHCKDGSVKWGETSLAVLRDADGNFENILAMIHDIDARKTAEEDLKTTMSDLQEHQAELIQAQKLATMGIMVSGIAHEINNPNNVILLAARKLEQTIADIKPLLEKHFEEEGDFMLGGMPYSMVREESPRWTTDIAHASLRIQKIIDSLKGFARPEIPGALSTIDLNAVVESTLVIASYTLKKATKNFALHLSRDFPRARGSSQQIELVLINLVTNACQALGNEEQAITISTRVEDDSWVVVAVEDLGRGIAPEEMGNIFDPFFTTNRSTGGTGLGLFLSYRIVKDHGGDLRVKSEPGQGTVFEIWLPAEQQQ